jgi:hypothetical protein
MLSLGLAISLTQICRGYGRMSEMFDSYVDAPGERSGRRGLIKVVVIGIIGTLVVAACVIGAEYWLRRSPYDDMVSNLRPGMHRFEVTAELGQSYKEVNVHFEYGNSTIMYQTKDSGWPLFIEFGTVMSDRGEVFVDVIKQWCGVPWDRNTSDQAGDPSRMDQLKFVCHKLQ